jgi:PAS domain S-box-containing protein
VLPVRTAEISEHDMMAVKDVRGILIIDTKGTIEGANSLIQQLTGYAEDELVGRPFSMFRHPSEHSRNEMQSVLLENAAGRPVSGEFRLFLKDEREAWFQLDFMPLRDDAGKHTATLVMARERRVPPRARERKLLYYVQI